MAQDFEDELASKMLNDQLEKAGDYLGHANKLVKQLEGDLAKKDEKLTQKDKGFEEREWEIRNDAHGDILSNVWLKYPDLEFSFLGPAMMKWIEVF
ncbi:hypothetical protein ACOSQ2_022560 [Xanthoceras sorbifolium]